MGAAAKRDAAEATASETKPIVKNVLLFILRIVLMPAGWCKRPGRWGFR